FWDRKLFLVALLRFSLRLRFVGSRGLRAFALPAFFLCGRFLDNPRSVHPFDECDWRRIAFPRAELDDARVAAFPVGGSRSDIVEQFFHRILLAKDGQRGAARMERSLFTEGHHLFRERANGLGFRQGSFDPLVLDQTTNLIREQRLPVLGGPPELDRFLLMSHGFVLDAGRCLTTGYFASSDDPLLPAPSAEAGVSTRPGSNFIPRPSCNCWSLSLISLSDFLPKFRYLSISASVFCASWPTVVMFALFRQFAARTLSSISFTLMLRSFFSFMFSSLTPAGVSSNSITSSLKFTKTSR